MSELLMIECPTCSKSVVWGEVSPYRPFCSKRCQLIDLGEWANEEKRIPSQSEDSDSDDWSEQPEQ
ncbi:DNA gyrase inhibitor YacG [Photorhabdus khanii]|uniref:DNA gyrase inhibitor YacG n=1 Tax=Photorhabdus khanii subsp. guanajuatensis TaxID=2100166 RepID=A0A4R4K665_9GAMM|nr:DNA gyrase inhibitor YacG [Photorhabdus khanii]TDB62152.1 DNA gyrase inhibitor YacG [Photorhabdus khanii subsp. guanajuatensis]